MISDPRMEQWHAAVGDKQRRELLKVFGVEYARLRLDNGDDLYVTVHGLPYLDLLIPENHWLDKEWIEKNSLKLEGTSAVYKVRTKTVNGRHKEFVLKWNRMGQDIPGVEDNNELINASFNSPFEEFALVSELRASLTGARARVAIQKPLAIYVPAAQIELSRLGRKEYKIDKVVSKHNEVALDKYRSYAVIYEWIKGIDTAFACSKKLLKEEFMGSLTMEGELRLNDCGFTVLDKKPHHIIVRYDAERRLLRDRSGKILFGLVDYELLERLPEREQQVKKTRRKEYLKRQKDRFKAESAGPREPHLFPVNVLGVDYTYGRVETTGGRLWVVGRDPYLFDYFMPERWKHTPRTRMSRSREMFHTVTKDNIHIVWEVSRVGRRPDMDPFKPDERRALEHGYNSPFEEFAFALELSRHGLTTIYPRAVYMKGRERKTEDKELDNSRYVSHRGILAPDGREVLAKNHEYIIIWGYWNGPDDKLAHNDADHYQGLDILKACNSGIITQEQYLSFIKNISSKLGALGYEDLDLRGNHIMLSLSSGGKIVADEQGLPELRICNFEFLKRL